MFKRAKQEVLAHISYTSCKIVIIEKKELSITFILFSDYYVWGFGLKVTGKGQGCVAVIYLTPYFGYFNLPYTLVSRCNALPKEVPKRIIQKEDRTDKRRRRFFYTFLYLLGSTTIPWMREFFLNTLKWLNPPVKVSKNVKSFHVCICPHLNISGFHKG